MRRSCATGIVLALATALALLAPGSASAGDRSSGSAVHQRVVSTVVGLHVAPRARIVGEPRTVVVTVRPHRSRYIRVQQLRGGQWSTVAHGRTTRAGRLQLRVPAPRSLATAYRAVAPRKETRSATFTEGTSARVRTTRDLQRVVLALPGSAAPSTAVTAVVHVRPVRRGRTVVLQRHVADTWVTYGNLKHESATGVARFRVVAGVEGAADFRAVVRARAGARTVMSHRSTLTVDDSAPAVPTGLTPVAGPGSVELTWDAVDDPDLGDYRVYYRLSTQPPGAWQLASPQPGTATTVTVTGLINETPYDFAVSSRNTAQQESALSDPVTATPSCTFGRVSATGRTAVARPAARVC